jgi:MFS family permease
LCRF